MTRRLAVFLLASIAIGFAHAEPLSRAEVVARALDANPDVQKSLEDLLA